MLVLGISGCQRQGKSLAASLLPGYLTGKRCINISYYDVIDFLVPGANHHERTAIIQLIQHKSPSYFAEHIKIKIAIWQNLYDVVILDDIDTEMAMQMVKVELKAVLIGVVKDYPYTLPYTVRDRLEAVQLGIPDIELKNIMTINGFQSSIRLLVDQLKDKALL